MKNITLHKGKLDILHRLPSSYFGNPRYLVRVDGFTCRTQVDAMLGYSITNWDGQNVVATIGTHYGQATINTLEPCKELIKQRLSKSIPDCRTSSR